MGRKLNDEKLEEILGLVDEKNPGIPTYTSRLRVLDKIKDYFEKENPHHFKLFDENGNVLFSRFSLEIDDTLKRYREGFTQTSKIVVWDTLARLNLVPYVESYSRRFAADVPVRVF